MHFSPMTTLMYYIDGKDYNLKLKGSISYSTNHTVSNHATNYLWPQGWTHRQTHIHKHTNVHKKVRSFKKKNVIGCVC